MKKYQEIRTGYYPFEGNIEEFTYREQPQNLETKVLIKAEQN